MVADAAYGTDRRFREAVSELGLHYVVGVMSSVSVWKPGEGPLSKRKWKGTGRRTKLLPRDMDHQSVTSKELARALPASAWKTGDLAARDEIQPSFTFRCGGSPAGTSDYWRSEPHPEEWLLIEWPCGEAEPIKYWLSTLPVDTKLGDLVRLAKQRWIIERDSQELKQELGLGHFEGRGWRGFHHHATLCIAAYGFLVAERSRFSPSVRARSLHLRTPQLPPDFMPRGAPRAGRAP